MAENVGDLNVKIGLDTSDLNKGEQEAIKSLGRTEGIMQKIADTIKKAFSAIAAGIVVRGLKDFLSGTEKSFASFQSAMANSLKNTVQNIKTFGSGLTSVLSSAGPSLANFALSWSNAKSLLVGGLIASVALAAIVSFTSYLNSAAQAMDATSLAATRLGQSTKNFTQLEYAVKSSGVEVDSFRSVMSTLSDNLQKDDALSPFIRGLQSLGLEAKDATSTSMSMDEVLAKVADKFKGMADGANKTAIATAIFGEKGADMIPVLNKGASAIDELKAAAERAGAVVGSKAASDARDYTEAVSRLGTNLSGIGNQITQAFLPAMTAVAKGLADFIEKSGIANTVGTSLRTIFGALYIAAKPVATVIEVAAKSIGNLLSALVAIGSGDMKGALDVLRGTGSDIAEIFKKSGQDVVNTVNWISPSLGSLVTSATGVTASLDKMQQQANKPPAPGLRAAKEILDAQAKSAADAANKVALLVQDKEIPLNAKLATLKTMIDNSTISWQQYYTAVRGANSVAKELSEELTRQNQAFAMMQAQDAMGNNKLPIQDKIDMLNASVRDGTIGWRDYMAMMKQVNEQGENAVNDLMSTTSQALTTIFKESKTAAIAAALINTYQAITKALASYPPPFSYAMAGLQAAMGFAQVSAIRNTNKGSSGGGGASSGSSAAATAAAASSGDASSAASAPSQTLYVQGIKSNELWSGDMVRGLANKLLDYQRDGGRVILGT